MPGSSFHSLNIGALGVYGLGVLGLWFRVSGFRVVGWVWSLGFKGTLNIKIFRTPNRVALRVP